jgi:hypothetical protein
MFTRPPSLLTITLLAIAVATSCGKKDDSTAPVNRPAAPPLIPGISQNLTRTAVAPTYYLDTIGTTSNPTSQKSFPVAGDSSVLIRGWAVDGSTKTLAGGIDVVIDGNPYAASYGTVRPDVSDHFKLPQYEKSGFELTLSPGQLTKGEHSVSIRVISSDKKSYYQGEVVKFVVS